MGSTFCSASYVLKQTICGQFKGFTVFNRKKIKVSLKGGEENGRVRM